ncbi:MAG: SoxR reducing system RseC family protein [Gammaproteobacteria bacterium]|nr:SoxR reducing system RseC family protein [Gammaproteobacteria bacterium]MDH5652603.1 SoxR reducing system RseC family protein [Gammaproteobacteria bacterium]
MIEETATVVRCEGDYAWVETTRKSACRTCAVNKGCGTSVLAAVVGNKPNQLRVVNRFNAVIGEQVTIGISESAMLRGAFLVYIIPLLMLIGFALAAEVLAGQLLVSAVDFAAVVGGLSGFAAGMYWVKHRTANLASDPRFQPVILRKSGTF